MLRSWACAPAGIMGPIAAPEHQACQHHDRLSLPEASKTTLVTGGRDCMVGARGGRGQGEAGARSLVLGRSRQGLHGLSRASSARPQGRDARGGPIRQGGAARRWASSR